jgi:pimeloyl-ACP methyl ester carboxylesterase
MTIDEIVTRDGGRLHAASEGEGPDVVLAHGYLDSHEGWDEVVPPLVRAGRRVVRFDQRGHGRSTPGEGGLSPRAMAADYADVLERFDVKDAVLVGHSMGAFLSVAFSILHADVARARLRGLVLASGHAGDVAKRSLQNRLQIAMLERGIMRLVLKRRTTARLMARSLFGDVAERRFLERAVDTFLLADLQGTLPILRAQISESYYARLGEIPVPAIVICGERDRTCPRFHSERLGAEIRGSRNVWLPRVGHMVTYEAPSVIVDAVESHLGSEGSRRTSVEVGGERM